MEEGNGNSFFLYHFLELKKYKYMYELNSNFQKNKTEILENQEDNESC